MAASATSRSGRWRWPHSAPNTRRFGQVFKEVKRGAPIDFFMFGKAIAEFEFLSSLPMRRSIVSRAATRTR